MLGTKILPAILVAVPATIWFATQPSFGESAGEICRASPGAAAPQGMHWYYRIDRATKQHCWYLNSEGLHVHSFGNVASPTPPQHENTGEQAGTASSDTVQTKAEQPAAIQAAAPEASWSQPVVPEHVTIGFAARWLELPKSLDLNNRGSASPSGGEASENNADANERQATNAEAQTSSSTFMVHDQRAALGRRSAARPSFGSILLAFALATILLFLCREAFRLAGTLHLEIKRRRARGVFPSTGDSSSVAASARGRGFWPVRPSSSDGSVETGLSELRRALRQAEAATYSPQSFAPPNYQAAKIPTVRRILRRNYLGRRAHSASSASSRNYAAV